MDPSSTGAQGLTSSGGPVTIPLGPGEWDEGLGIPMCVVCQGVSWSIEIQDPPEPLSGSSMDDDKPQGENAAGLDDGTSAVAIFEQTIKDPKRDASMTHPGSQHSKSKVEVDTSDMQSFLTKQLEVLEQLKIEDEKDRTAKPVPQLEMSPLDDNGRVNEHIGPVQFNMGGIQVDADDMLRKLKVSDDFSGACLVHHLINRLGERGQPIPEKGYPFSTPWREIAQPSTGKLLCGLGQEAWRKPSREPIGIVSCFSTDVFWIVLLLTLAHRTYSRHRGYRLSETHCHCFFDTGMALGWVRSQRDGGGLPIRLFPLTSCELSVFHLDDISSTATNP
ncbi:unnamed protein product [Aspergillus oryzae]|nr:unnamed protein product [Aspergillus oryzae]GMF93540.1 unnamed protein product [Aspergillus oryzae]